MRFALVPGAPALLPEYAGRVDPVAPMRECAQMAVRWLLGDVLSGDDPGEVVVLGAARRTEDAERGVARPASERVAGALLSTARPGARLRYVEPDAVDTVTPTPDLRLLVVADGSARRTEKAPGHFDPRAADFDAGIEKVLRSGDLDALAGLDLALGNELWAAGAPVLAALGRLGAGRARTTLDHADDPYGVRYWVLRGETVR